MSCELTHHRAFGRTLQLTGAFLCRHDNLNLKVPLFFCRHVYKYVLGTPVVRPALHVCCCCFNPVRVRVQGERSLSQTSRSSTQSSTRSCLSSCARRYATAPMWCALLLDGVWRSAGRLAAGGGAWLRLGFGRDRGVSARPAPLPESCLLTFVVRVPCRGRQGTCR